MTPVFNGIIRDGKLYLSDRQYFDNYIVTFKDGDKVSVEVKKYHPQRSDQQNKYYWSVIIPILGDFLGYDKEECHEALKWHFLKMEGKIPTVKSTRKLDTSDFSNYIEKICRWAAEEFSIFIPPPHEG